MAPMEAWSSMGEKIATWFIFSVLMALVPLAAGVAKQMTSNADINLAAVVAQGQLLLITAGLCATSLGDLIGSGKTARTAKILAGGFTLVVLTFATLYFADITAALAKGEALNIDVIRNTSLACYASAFVAGGSCVALSRA
jgi:hypothetical protein